MLWSWHLESLESRQLMSAAAPPALLAGGRNPKVLVRLGKSAGKNSLEFSIFLGISTQMRCSGTVRIQPRPSEKTSPTGEVFCLTTCQ